MSNSTWRTHHLPVALIAFALAGAAACAQPSQPPTSPAQPAPAAAVAGPHENLHAVLWMQTAFEFRAVAKQAYALATIRLQEALKDPRWTAAIEQTDDPSSLPPAVILDVDETVLDNSVYQARLVRDAAEFGEGTWSSWVNEAQADPIPGAVEFTRAAQQRGVTVFYVTNRKYAEEEPTRRNLEHHKFALDPSRDTIYTQGERPEWSSSDKSARRKAIAAQFRILLLIGDDFGDFAPAKLPLNERRDLFEKHQAFWGERWIALPNAMYGSWEATLYGFDYQLKQAEKLKMKRDHLRTKQH